MQHTVDLESITVPNYISAKRVFLKGTLVSAVEPAKFHISELSVETLESVCNQFRRDLFEKAGKELPGLKAV